MSDLPGRVNEIVGEQFESHDDIESEIDTADALVTIWQEVAAALKPTLDDHSTAELYGHCLHLARSTDKWLSKVRDSGQPLLGLVTLKAVLLRQSAAHDPWGNEVQSSLLDANEALVLSALRAQEMLEAAEREAQHLKLEGELRLKSELLLAENREIAEASRHKSEFLSTMSHELRTPLNAIIGFAEILQRSPAEAGTPKHQGYLGHISNSGRHLLHLVEDILDVSRIEAGKMSFAPVPVDLEAACAEALAVMAPSSAKAGLELVLDVESGLGEAVIDPLRFKQVLYNYLSNAIKFTGKSGTVTLRAKAKGPERFRIEVEDSGIGIAPSDVHRLFGIFEQLDSGSARRHQGSGLGLAVTRRLVEAQGGTVGVTSTLGVGSVFYAVLPRQPATAPLPVVAPNHPQHSGR